ncbi:hypothetical protein [Sciscionella marina]|uniref:hypothetical protein n=1 Tax=Sciscionella marina TaxID=508770 RepID=UPI000381B33E|nr:hypothetical protein [Sciscionella marina]
MAWTTLREHGLTGLLGGIATQLIATEAMHHQLGWDRNAPSLYRVFSRNTPERCWVEQLPLDRHPARLCAELDQLRDTEPDITQHRAWPPVAHILVLEGWSREYRADSVDQAERLRAARDHADLPGSVEVREAVAVTEDRQLQLHRQRGCRPLFSCRSLAEEPGVHLAGDLLARLRVLHCSTIAVPS